MQRDLSRNIMTRLLLTSQKRMTMWKRFRTKMVDKNKKWRKRRLISSCQQLFRNSHHNMTKRRYPRIPSLLRNQLLRSNHNKRLERFERFAMPIHYKMKKNAHDTWQSFMHVPWKWIVGVVLWQALRPRESRLTCLMNNKMPFGLHPRLVSSLSKYGVKQPTIIQTRAIHALQDNTNQNLFIQSETGSGKTLAYHFRYYR